MTSNMVDIIAPIVTPLPDPPGDQYFTDLQWTTLMAIMDTVIPSIHKASVTNDPFSQLSVPDEQYSDAVAHMRTTISSPPSSEALEAYLNEKPSDIPAFQDILLRTLTIYAREDARKVLGFILTTLNTRLGSLMLTGYASPLQSHPISIRESILTNWRNSYFFPLRAIAKTMSLLGKNIWLKTSPSFDRVTGFTKVPDHYKPGPHYEYEFLQFPAGEEPWIVETDVVIVGSGCGGAVCAKNMAEDGHKVVVVEKSYYYPPSQLPMSEATSGVHLFENGGIIVNDDSSMSVVAGSSWGGGGTINWSASLQTQDFVRKEWSEDRGLKFFGSTDFQDCLDRICEKMGVSAEYVRQNHGNRVLLEGSRKLGFNAKPVPQNTGGHEHYCGHCSNGCGSSQKQGPVVSWLPDAAKAGAEFTEGLKVDHVIFDESDEKKAVGVKGVWTSRNSQGGVDGPLSGRTVREVIVKAKKVIISTGTLWTPIILKNSGLTNPQIGRNLYLHPVSMVNAVFPEDVKPWEGGILTSVCSSFENLDSHGHGVKLETTCMMPSLCLPFLNYPTGFDYKFKSLFYRHMNSFISIARDRDSGLVYPDAKTGLPRVSYTPSDFDRGHILQGVLALAKICYVSGAREIHTTAQGLEPFVRSPSSLSTNSNDFSSDPAFQTWLTKLSTINTKPPASQFASAHQMGTSRMSTRPENGVVDPKGKVWGVENLYVSDASVFPSASGVNPMITNMAISDWISRGISKELNGQVGGERVGERARL
ncbi:hypothetical protein BGAL_0014g00430 [Botrytis galanthina]|uniref:Long-chain-alcohol oxidase n=1 Tax=Botrytis galanthina TaxID=278940 RepID=A0A4S8RAE3_9HELO|nr:hypothetical protein BGAL_0014g00430 [Botrytis galanthina]